MKLTVLPNLDKKKARCWWCDLIVPDSQAYIVRGSGKIMGACCQDLKGTL